MGDPLPRFDKCGRRLIPELPWLPYAGRYGEPQPTYLVGRAHDSMKFPELFAKKSWTKSLPYKDTYEYYKPNETMGASYTPCAMVLKTHFLPPYKKKAHANPLGADGKLQHPPPMTKEEQDRIKKEEEAALKRKTVKVPGIVDVRDLLNGTYWEDKRMKEEKMAKRKLKRLAKQQSQEKPKTVEPENWEKFQADLPFHPDDQKRDMLRRNAKEMIKPVRVEDIYRINYYLTDGFDDKHIAEYPIHYFVKAKATIPDKYKKLKMYELIDDLFKEEVNILYNKYMRVATFKYILQDFNEARRLKIESFPHSYPTFTIRAPVPWHTPMLYSREGLFRHLFIGCEAIIKIRDLWERKYTNMCILDVADLEEDQEFPLHMESFEETLIALCNKTRNVLTNVWLKECADIFCDLRPTWEHFIPRQKGDNMDVIEMFFNCVNTLMSLQVRGMVMKSLNHFMELLIKYKDGNNYEGEYVDLAVLNIPLLKLIAVPTPNSTKITVQPPIAAAEDILINSLKKILEVNYNLPRLENIMFPAYVKNETYLIAVKDDEVVIMDLFDEIRNIYAANILGPDKYLEMYAQYDFLLTGEADKQCKDFMKSDPPPLMKDIIKRIAYYDDLKDELIMLRRSIPLGLVSLELSDLNDYLIQIVSDMRLYIVNIFVTANYKNNRAICNTFDEMSLKMNELPETVQELVALQNYVVESRDVTLYKLKENIRETGENLLFLMDYAILTSDDINLNSRVFLWPKDMENVIEMALQRLTIKRDQAEAELRNKRMIFDATLLKHEKLLKMFQKKDPTVLSPEEIADNVDLVETIVARLMEDKAEALEINEEEQLLDFDPSPFMNLQEMIATIEPFDRLWHTVASFHDNYDIWFYGPFKELDADQIKDDVENMWRTLYKLSKTFHNNPGAKRIADLARAKVEKFRQFVPVLQTVCNKGLQDRHWKEISKIVGIDLKVSDQSTLNDMIEAGLVKFIPKLEELSAAATKEYALEKGMAKMKEDWADVTFELVPYRDTGVCILTALDDIQVMLDDNILKAQTMRGSPYVKAFEKEVQLWEEKLVSMQDIIEAWLLCQSTWMYLEPIFSSEDIMRQMPTEARNFKQVDKTWRHIMANTMLDIHVLAATDYPNMLQQLRDCNNLLDQVQKGLNNYLEKKRLFFPRFFFLSNDELLEILSETKDPLRVQPHLKKCFEGIYLLKFTPQEEVIGMISADNEVVNLSSKIVPAESKGMVEKWLLQVQLIMLQSMKDIMNFAVKAFTPQSRKEWILSWPGQIIQACDCIIWTTDVTEAITNNTLDNQVALCTEQIKICVEMVQGKLEPSTQITIEALIVIDVHARDIVKQLNMAKVQSIADFAWISQMRFYWQTNYVGVCMITTEVAYGFEYLGNLGRLVATPLTDRCFRTLMGAFKLNLGGAPEGPAGTGKTESCKDLAKAVAKKCVVFNCSDGLDYKALGKFFKGLAQSGAWACFDEFNRIELEVLSVVAQQILTIQMAVAAKLEKFVFEGTELVLDPTCTCFITMNPGYAGRQELPDNLKVLFRTVAMMVPDYAMIGEISLYSYGFTYAASLAQKIVHTYKLCSEQLSSQNHYDYGMRAVKSVLLAAGALKRAYSKFEEAPLVLRAIIDVNLPKFLGQDLPLFAGIYSDLFPGVEVPKFDRTELIDCLIEELVKRNLQPTPWYVGKVMQVYEMILVRHGLMIVGNHMAGKTQGYQSLGEALGKLAADRTATLKEVRVVYRIINPKAISMGKLYGQFDPASHEWSDGVLATTFREYANSQTMDRKWILFDGPVDAVWIENMNTVLDDNKKLCLMSGEIIQMSNKMNLIFEPEDLEFASPATVSRCGMIYLESHLLGWQPFMTSYLNTLSKTLLAEQLELLEECLLWLVPPLLDCFRLECKIYVHTSEIHLFFSFTRLLSGMLVQETQVSTIWLQCAMLFALTWGLASTLSLDGRKTFDVFFRKLTLGENKAYPKPKSFKLTKNQLHPERGLIFDYVYDKRNNGTWVVWADTLDQKQVIPPTANVNEVIVQTNDSICQKFFLNLCLKNAIPALFVGPTGTGKSAIVLDHMVNLPKEKYLANVVNFSARTTSTMTQEIIMSKLDKRRRGVFGPSMGKLCVLFVDDVGMPQKEQYGAQPPIELLRQWIDHGHWFDKDTSMLFLIDMMFVSAMGVPGGGANMVTPRFLRHMQVICMDSFEDATLSKIFGALIEWHFSKGYEDDVFRFSKNSVGATMDVYHQAMDTFLPTPTKAHYMFNLRDFARVIKGLMLTPPARMKDPDKLVRLWVHETYRVFNDRLINDEDKAIFFQIVVNSCYQNFRKPLDKVLVDFIPEDGTLNTTVIRDIFFGNYGDPDADPKIYDDILDLDDLTEKMNYYLNEFNMVSKSPMNLVMFKFAIEHVSRVSRVLLQDNGNVLLVGIGGSGRHSAVKLAASMAEYLLFEIEISRNYGPNEWRDDIKRLLLNAGCEGKRTTFLFCDTQIADESFVEDINMILNTADIPNLYQPDEKVEILEKMQNAARDSGKKIDSTPLALYNFFIDRVKKHLHIALAMSPIGEAFRKRCRMFPSLVNCCTIDWFTNWPPDALERVADMFLKQTDLVEDMIGKCTIMCQHFHTAVETASANFFREQKRKTYVTPTSYLELIQTFKSLYYLKVEQITLQQQRYETGLDKLDFAASQVGTMQEELHALQPKLVVASAKTEKLMVKIEQDTIVVEKKKEIVGADEALANEAAAAAQAIKDDCESDLAEATPALEAAVGALDTLKPADIVIVKSMKNPPFGVKLVMESVCVMKGIKPDRKPDPSTGRMAEDYWGPSQKLLGDMKFLEGLKTYDKDNIQPAIMKRIRDKYITDREFDPERIHSVSTACEGICKWVRALEVYDRVIKIVAPKKARLAEAEGELAAQMETLNGKRAQLQEVADKLQALNDEFASETRKKKDLEDDINLCSQKLERAEKLIGGLGGEKQRWSDTAKYCHSLLGNVIGDVLLSAGMVAYLGPFTVDYRQNIIKAWNVKCLQLAIPCSDPFSLVLTLGEPVVIRAWNIAGLPVDNFSVENGIISTMARRWPLAIDPQGQANKWIKNMEKHRRLQVIKLTDSNYVRTVENAITFGLPVILENIAQEIDAVLEPVLVKNIFKSAGCFYLKLGDSVLEYNFDFRFYITTRLRNPHYLPEVAVKVTLVNFMITPQGLQDQLLGIVVAMERPELEEKKNEMIVEGANNKKMLKEIEDQILQVLSSSEGNILEDETAIRILSSSKILSEEIQEKQKIAAVTEVEIDNARNSYIPVSKHSSILFFCISELGNIDPMYQSSLSWFINLYTQSIIHSPKSDDLATRLNTLNEHFTASIYKNVCRSLFEKDKLIFSFVLTVGILRARGQIEEDVFNFLLTGGVALSNPYPNPAPDWLTEKSWSEVVRATNLTGMDGFLQAVQKSPKEWKNYYDVSNPHDIPCPAPMNKLKGLQRLVAVRCIRPDKVVPAVQLYIGEEMGQAYLEPPQFNLQESYNDSNCCTPLVFILSAGSDPMAGLIRFAADKGIPKTALLTISLGQGQGPIAAGMINRALVTGQWVVLQNCHLAESWMRELDRITDEVIVPDVTNVLFRLWLTSYPSRAFPVSILQNGVKMTNEAPKGLRQNLLRSYLNDPISDSTFYNACPRWREWQMLLFSLCFFHALVQERKKFGPLGWNIPYEFNESDLRICILQLQMFLTDYKDVPFEALTYLTGECNYGGRVTDDKDRRLLNSLLSMFYAPEVIIEKDYKFSESGTYFVPEDTSYEGCIKYIKTMPLIPQPEVYGLHENADITKDNQETLMLLHGILLTQPQITSGGGGEGEDEAVIELSKNINSKIPQQFNMEEVCKQYPVMYTNSMNTVLRQELIRFNRLTSVIKRTLTDVAKAIKGLVVMSSELENVYLALMVGKVPEAWLSKSYPSLKPLGSYINDFIRRLDFLQAWIDNNAPSVFWLSGFYFTQSFLTGVLQNYARKQKLPIDFVLFEFYVTKYETDAPLPALGVHCYGLFLEGARWDRKKGQLNESFPKILFDTVPIMWLKPVEKTQFRTRPCYDCPIYKTSARRGTLSTTGHSTNFVMFTTFDSDVPQKHWINRGVASLCQLDD
ncbi:dynein axonemal heavy chain 3 isoform X2 [Onthophagus taurus]|uniref:dynein axonemal heavy chain 3 isoform X2 n=1 Tax=Onthophagus taurus TaxID=166361 RepID=UPI0039BE6D6E